MNKTLFRPSSYRSTLFAGVAFAAVLAAALTGCSDLWGKLDNPADEKSDDYLGYVTKADVNAIGPVYPAVNGTLIGATVTVNKIDGAILYAVRVGFSAATVVSSPLFTNEDATTNVINLSGASLVHGTKYYWQSRAKKSGADWGAWCAPTSFTTNFTTLAATPIFNLVGGTYTSNQNVTISCATAGATIYYTTDGSTPTTSSTQYSGAISVAGHGTVRTIKAIAIATGFAVSTTANATYWISYPPAATPTFNPSGGTYSSDQSVTISCTTTGATIYYTTDGATPTTLSTPYSGAIAVAGHSTVRNLKAIAVATGYSTSATANATYTISYPAAATPSFNPVGGTYTSDKTVTISCATAGATIYYTTDNSAPTTSSSQYSVAIPVAGHGTTKTIKAIAIATGYLTSATASATYTINYPAAATPTFNPAGGTYTSDQSVTISCATTGATIYYTTDGATPTTLSTPYSGAIAVAGHSTVRNLKAIAVATGFTISATASATYTINYPPAATPTFNPAGGTYTSVQSVTISCTTAGATIYYTTDGSDPASSGTRSSSASPVGPITATVSPATTIRAIATAPYYTQSAEGSATYTNVTALLTMVSIPAGSFSMGSTTSSDEQPIHTVSLNAFSLGKYEVTQAQYTTVMGSSPSYFTGDTARPVEQVSWYNAVAFCNALSGREGYQNVYTISGTTVTADFTKNGYRLPTEAEWEYAARGATSSQGYTYSGSNTIGNVAWYYDNSYALGSSNPAYGPHSVGTKAANELGLHDMSGNVWEWCWDWYGSSYYSSSPASNPSGPTTGSYRVNRGGGWAYSADFCRSAYRGYYTPSYTAGSIGFRVARSPGL